MPRNKRDVHVTISLKPDSALLAALQTDATAACLTLSQVASLRLAERYTLTSAGMISVSEHDQGLNASASPADLAPENQMRIRVDENIEDAAAAWL